MRRLLAGFITNSSSLSSAVLLLAPTLTEETEKTWRAFIAEILQDPAARLGEEALTGPFVRSIFLEDLLRRYEDTADEATREITADSLVVREIYQNLVDHYARFASLHDSPPFYLFYSDVWDGGGDTEPPRNIFVMILAKRLQLLEPGTEVFPGFFVCGSKKASHSKAFHLE